MRHFFTYYKQYTIHHSIIYSPRPTPRKVLIEIQPLTPKTTISDVHRTGTIRLSYTRRLCLKLADEQQPHPHHQPLAIISPFTHLWPGACPCTARWVGCAATRRIYRLPRRNRLHCHSCRTRRTLARKRLSLTPQGRCERVCGSMGCGHRHAIR